MPLAAKKVSRSRISFETSLSGEEIQQLIADKDLKTLQCSTPVKSQTWDLLNNQFFPIRPEVELRVYGFYSLVCDLGFTSRMTNVRHFSADCLRDVAGIEHVTAMEQLESLDIKLGAIKNLHAIAGMENIKYLELWQVKGLTDIGVISSLTGLQHLFLQSLRQITALPSLKQLKKLRRISLENMKGLKDISALEHAPGLEEFIHVAAENMQPEDYLPLLRNRQLKRTLVGFGSEKKNNRFKDLLQEHRIQSFVPGVFAFV